MQCQEFERRLNSVLDERQRPQADPLLAAHVAGCEDCRQVLSLHGALLEGLSRRNLPALSPDFAARVVAAVGPERPVVAIKQRSPRVWLVIGAVLASAAIMHLAVSLVRLARRGEFVAAKSPGQENTFAGKAPRQPSRLAMAQPGAGRRKATPQVSQALSGADWLIEAPRLPSRLREYRGAIDELVVSWPGAATRLDEMERVAPGIRPLRASFSIIWETLSFTIPSAGTKPGAGEVPTDGPDVSGSSLLPASALAGGLYSFRC